MSSVEIRALKGAGVATIVGVASFGLMFVLTNVTPNSEITQALAFWLLDIRGATASFVMRLLQDIATRYPVIAGLLEQTLPLLASAFAWYVLMISFLYHLQMSEGLNRPARRNREQRAAIRRAGRRALFYYIVALAASQISLSYNLHCLALSKAAWKAGEQGAFWGYASSATGFILSVSAVVPLVWLLVCPRARLVKMRKGPDERGLTLPSQSACV